MSRDQSLARLEKVRLIPTVESVRYGTLVSTFTLRVDTSLPAMPPPAIAAPAPSMAPIMRAPPGAETLIMYGPGPPPSPPPHAPVDLDEPPPS